VLLVAARRRGCGRIVVARIGFACCLGGVVVLRFDYQRLVLLRRLRERQVRGRLKRRRLRRGLLQPAQQLPRRRRQVRHVVIEAKRGRQGLRLGGCRRGGGVLRRRGHIRRLRRRRRGEQRGETDGAQDGEGDRGEE